MTDMEPIFRMDEPPHEHLKAFQRDGYIAFPSVFTEAGLAGLTDEILDHPGVRAFLMMSDEERHRLSNPFGYFERPWNNRAFWSDRLIDAPLVTALLKATLGSEYHFCHSALHVSLRGSRPIGLHQDHHHWFHDNPINLAEREKGYIQILYYPNGFTRGDRNLSVVPGSHRISPLGEIKPEDLLGGVYDQQAGRPLRLQRLELPPGSMVFLNARMFHGVEAKPMDSSQAFRLFVIDIFKEAGPPHRYTQEIPAEWMERAGPERMKLYQRPAYTPDCWISRTPSKVY